MMTIKAVEERKAAKAKAQEEEFNRKVASREVVPHIVLTEEYSVTEKINRIVWAFQAAGLLKDTQYEICRIKGQSLEVIDAPDLIELVASRVEFAKLADDGMKYVPPDMRIIKAGLRKVAKTVTNVTDVPSFAPDWTIDTTQGITSDGTYMLETTITPDMNFESIPAAIEYLENELLYDMLFKDAKDKLNYWSLLFTPVVQRLIKYHRAPFFLVHKPKRGIGATVMLDTVIVNYGGEGMPQAALTNDKNDYQIANELIGHLAQGTKMLNYDDIMGSLSRKTLVKFQTNANPSERGLGGNSIIQVENPYLVLCGTGTTTLVKLLCRLYDPTEGRITVDGIDLKELRTLDLRGEISVIFQDYSRYNLTASENIWLGRAEIPVDHCRVAAAASTSGADDVIGRLKDGYQTILGKWFEEGTDLSIGEWQKVALARVFMRDFQIIILDEPTSSLDPKAESEVSSRLKELLNGKTAIIISHRLSTTRLADPIIFLKDGCISEEGTHDRLIALGGDYADIFEVQAAKYR